MPGETETMIHPGQSVQNPVTGETLVFHETALSTDGCFVRFETIARPNAFVAAAHVHPYQTECFDVLTGTLGLRVGREKLELGPGGAIDVEPGVAHKWWNAGPDELRFLCEVRPALAFESLIETMYGLAADGKTNRKGMPNPFRLAVVAKHHFDTVRLPVVPHALQKAALAVGAPLGRLLGYEPTYDPAAAPAYAY
jgi:mannose-6-phosphate isomerase-like protein (cupin superfamily)